MANDYISRESALDFLIPTDDLSISSQDQWALGDRFEKFLESIPAADVRPVVRGKWMGETGFIYADLAKCVRCSECGSFAYFYDKMPTNFCPNCGADMMEVKADG